MLGQNVTKCTDGKCPYGEPWCCYECDHRIREGCRVRCSDDKCRRAHLVDRLGAKEK